MGETEDERASQAGQLFENFVQVTTCKGTLQAFSVLCRQLELDPSDHRNFYSSLKAAVTYWKAKGLWGKLDKRATHKEYCKGKTCVDTRCLIIGGGPCGFRTAIELALLGAKVVVIEKRDTFSRNNVLHLWPYTIHDLRNLGAKKFYGKFCAGSIDHISIRQLQLMLLKIALILGVEVHVNVEFLKPREPPEDQGPDGPGWRAEIRPADHLISDYEFDVIIGADGRRNTLDGFRRKEFRGKLAIAITANFVNRNTTAEAKVEEISGVAFIFNQKFFLELKEETGIDLENIVYYRDNTHYFVMTAKKQSLLDKGVIINDYIETERLLASDNVNQEALLSYAREAADFGTNYQLPSLDYAINHYGQPDVAMFDFTCMYASENAALVREKNGHQLLVALVGDSLLEPFWPMGTGCARGFLAAFDTVWMIKGWAQGKEPLDLLSERESIYRLLPQTTAENISKNFELYTIDPSTRYPNLNSTCVRPHQVRHLCIKGEQDSSVLERNGPTRRSVNLSRGESEVRPSRLLFWCQKQTRGYRGVDVTDLTTSWRSGLALCALIHRQQPDLIDFDSLNEADCAKNNQLAFDVAEREFGIQPITTGKEMDAERGPDKLIMILYLSKFYEMFRNSAQPATGVPKEADANNEDYSSKTANSVHNSINLALPRKRIPKVDKKLEDNDFNKKRKKGIGHLEELFGLLSLIAPLLFFSHLMSNQGAPSVGERGEQKENKVRSMATQLLARFEENAPSCASRRQTTLRKDFPQGLGGSDTCHFCKKRVYVMERLSAEGNFFHRECFRCHICGCTLRLGGHTYDSNQGTFYCKLHFSQRITSSRHRRGEVHGSGRPSTSTTSDYLAADGHHVQPSGTLTSFIRKSLRRPLHVGRTLFDFVVLQGLRNIPSLDFDFVSIQGKSREANVTWETLHCQRRNDQQKQPLEEENSIHPPLFGFQNWANSFRKSFSSKGNNPAHRGTSDTKRIKQENIAVRQTKREQLKRLHRAQMIQRQLEEVEERQRALEEKGVALEKVLRGETDDDSTDETALLQTWFKLVLEKNKLARYESELMIFAQELELEDTQSRLQRELRQRMATEGELQIVFLFYKMRLRKHEHTSDCV
ncbi:protein-methionine sulfoxide oxidase MICAL3 [Triplophysa rosa]|uniref:F-actin monooxygenase n=1 Tax=Triplophysa rosa TaxID=992332 RepID=A0A9W7X192_TRIRA|nr:protein-methionine sulfoxide oxidase MICAL3 [Triplophysa rosa]